MGVYFAVQAGRDESTAVDEALAKQDAKVRKNNT